MAAQAVQDQAVPAPQPTAVVVGNAFARQYYAILEQSPALVYRFYQEMSQLGRVEKGGVMGSTTTMDAINGKIQAYGSLKADVKFVDAQESYNGGVIVLVTGSMIGVDDSRRDFTQTFFLAPQDKGYFVLNDILRYLEDDSHPGEKQGDCIAPNTPIQANEEFPEVQEKHVSEQSNGEVYKRSENAEVPVDNVEEEEEEEEPVAEVVDEAPNESEVVVESNVKVQEPPKKSYASIVMKDTPVAAPSPNPKPVLKMQPKQVSAATAPSPVQVSAPSSTELVDVGNNQDQEVDGHSIYLKNLPINVPYDLVEEAFKKFGPIKSGSIQIRNSKGFCFGFVEFEEAGSAQSAIEASPITVGGRDVVVEEKRSTSSRGNNRGRYPPGRGGGFRSEGGRGRGGYGGGRGYGRGESNGNRGGGGRGYQNRSGEGYQRSDHSGNGSSGRVNRGGGSGFGAPRAQRVSAQA